MDIINGCSICEDPSSAENPIVSCVECGVRVHVYCYGIVGQFENWKCSPCQSGKTKFVKCHLCTQKQGAMKQTECNKWVHVICALFTNGVVFMDEETMEPIDISKLSKNKLNKRCSFCYNSCGYCCLCANKKCKNRFHITCAQKNKTLKEHINSDETIKFYAYCHDHRPKESSRRLSSEAVKKSAIKKQDKLLKTQAASENAQWLLSQLGNHSASQSEEMNFSRE